MERGWYETESLVPSVLRIKREINETLKCFPDVQLFVMRPGYSKNETSLFEEQDKAISRIRLIKNQN